MRCGVCCTDTRRNKEKALSRGLQPPGTGPVSYTHLIPITATIVNSLLVTLIIIGLSIFLTRNLKVRAVSRRQVVAEFLVETCLLYTSRCV